LGFLWLGLLTIGFLAVRIVIFSVDDLPPTQLPFNRLPNADLLYKQYMYPWMRCTVWMTGIGLGYLLHRLRGKEVTMKGWQWLTGWLIAFAVGVSVTYGMVGYQMPWDSVPKAVAVTYGGLHRFAWGLAVSWVIFACVTGYGGFVNTFLSYPGFIPLSRLTYATYLIHCNVINFVDKTAKSTVYFDSIRLVYRLLSAVVVSVAFAVPLHLAFEAPFVTLENLAFSLGEPDVDLGVKQD